MKEEIQPLHMVLPDQFIDRTHKRIDTFFDGGIAAHVGFSHPICPRLRAALHGRIATLGFPVHNGGTYVCIDGPQFSTRAESLVYRSWKVDVIGITNLQEAKLAREAEICYTTIALVTDYDCWHPDHENVTVDMIVANLMANAEMAKRLIAEAVGRVPAERGCTCGSALSTAIITDRQAIPADLKWELAPLIGKKNPFCFCVEAEGP